MMANVKCVICFLYFTFSDFAVFSKYSNTTENILQPSEKESYNLMIQEGNRLCGPASICESNSSAMTEDLYTTQCCQDCSCDEDCGLRGDCCFPTPEAKQLEQDRRTYQECIAPMTKVFLSSENYKHNFYYMTTRCPAGKSVRGTEDREDCGNIPIAQWGSLYPIYSSSTGRIYKNRVCADCHGVSDGVLWMTYMDCRKSGFKALKETSLAEHFDWLGSNSVSTYCQLRFKFGQMLKTERCFLDIVNTCEGTDVVIPEWSKMTPEQVTEACNDGIEATFQHFRPYLNVFCYLCNGGRFAEECIGIDSGSFGPASSITFLLNDGLFAGEKQRESSALRRHPTACLKLAKEKTVGDCVPIHCPSGQIYSKNFQCVQVASDWINQYYHVGLRLNFVSDKLNTSSLAAIIQESNSWLLSPWPKWWTVENLFYETEGDANTTYVKSLLVFITSRPFKRHIAFLREIKRHIQMLWTVNDTAKSIELSADFLEYTIDLASNADEIRFAPRWYVRGFGKLQTRYLGLFKENSIQSIIQKVYRVPSDRITKTFFCRQVSLGRNSSSYELLAYNTLLHYNGRFYFDGEFEIDSKEDGESEPRICLSDSLYGEVHEERFSCAPKPAVIVIYIQLARSFLRLTGVP